MKAKVLVFQVLIPGVGIGFIFKLIFCILLIIDFGEIIFVFSVIRFPAVA